MNIMGFLKSHPVEAGAAVLIGGAGLLYLMGFFGGGSSSASSGGDPNAAAFFAAQSAEAQSGNALQAVQIQAQATTAQDLIGATANQNINQIWASTNLATTQANNATAITLAPTTTENNLISTLGSVASIAPTTVTSQSSNSSSGFFGIGASNSVSTNTSIVPNPAALDASGLLAELVSGGYSASH